MEHINNDVIWQICEFLDLKTLIILSRVSSALNSLSCKFINGQWKRNYINRIREYISNDQNIRLKNEFSFESEFNAFIEEFKIIVNKIE